MIRLTNVKRDGASNVLKEYWPGVVCVDNVEKCYGDIFGGGCGVALGTC